MSPNWGFGAKWGKKFQGTKHQLTSDETRRLAYYSTTSLQVILGPYLGEFGVKYGKFGAVA